MATRPITVAEFRHAVISKTLKYIKRNLDGHSINHKITKVTLDGFLYDSDVQKDMMCYWIEFNTEHLADLTLYFGDLGHAFFESSIK